MNPTRRRLLGAGAAIAVGSSGCLGSDAAVEYPEAETADADGDEPANDGSARGRETAELTNPELADRTRAILDDVRWFATAYDEAIETYVATTDELVEAIAAARETVAEAEQTDPEVVEGLERRATTTADVASDALSPQFDPGPHLRRTAERHLDEVKRFAERGDTIRVLEELDRMEQSVRSLSSRTAAETRHSREPIHNRLRDRLAAEGPEGLVFGLRHATTGFAGFAYDPDHESLDDYGPLTFRGPPFDQDRLSEVDDALGPVRDGADRVDELYVSVATRPTVEEVPAYDGHPDDLGGEVVHVQRYADTDAATAALDRIVAAGATEGRRDVLGSTPWHRYYYPYGNGVMYGYVGRAGDTLLAFGFSRTAWEERVSWRNELVDGWLASV